jgi:hypothetical protein
VKEARTESEAFSDLVLTSSPPEKQLTIYIHGVYFVGMKIGRILSASLLFTVITAGNSGAQQAPVPGEELTVYLMTMGPGDEIFEKFGHTAIWIRNNATHTDVAYNWGLFDFNDKDFIARLARGRMRYSMAGFQMQAMVQSYIEANRSVSAQELNLTPAQRLQVQALADSNALPENRYYLYDYYRNNCSSLPRDLLDRVLGGAIKAKTDHVLTNTTFRQHTLRILGDDLLPYLGAQFALGHPADARITQWQEMFLPLEMQKHFRTVWVRGETGALEPLVASEIDIAKSSRPPQRTAPPNYVRRFTLIGIGMALAILILLSLSLTGLRTTKVILAFLVSLIAIIGGLAGLFLILAWTVTDHVFMANNENILQLNPLLLAFGLFLPFAYRNARARKIVTWLAFSGAGLSLLGFVMQLLPMFNQPNGEIIGLALPVHAALALVCWFQFSEQMKTTHA